MLSVITRPPGAARLTRIKASLRTQPGSRRALHGGVGVNCCIFTILLRVFFDPDLPARRMLQLPDRGDLL